MSRRPDRGSLFVYIIHRALLFFNYFSLSFSEIIWNWFVYLMPSRLVFALRPRAAATQNIESFPRATESSHRHAAKSAVLRNVFRLDNAGLLSASPTTDAPPGLGNWDNSCYQNSVLQALASVECLPKFLEESQGRNNRLPEATTTNALRDIIRDLNDLSNYGRRLWTPPKLKAMSSWEQQDAQEYFSKIVEEVDREAVLQLRRDVLSRNNADVVSPFTIPHSMVDSKINHAENCESTRKIGTRPGGFSSTILQNPMEGLLAQRVGCTRCGYSEGLSLIPFNCLTLPLGPGWLYDLEGCLDEYTHLDHIEGVECAKCSLLQAKHHLRELSETIATVADDESQDMAERRDEYQASVEARLSAVSEALREEDFSEATLSQKCHIPSQLRVNSTKTRQAIVMRAPKCLVMHVNRSLFDESSGAQTKNYAELHYQKSLDLTPWCMGNKLKLDLKETQSITEEWEMDPCRSMISKQECFNCPSVARYELRSVVTHYGRHDNGHYICYKRLPRLANLANTTTVKDEGGNLTKGVDAKKEKWWRLSDEDATQVSEEDVLSQGGAFMLFYERIEEQNRPRFTHDAHVGAEDTALAPLQTEMDQLLKGKSNEDNYKEIPSGKQRHATAAAETLAAVKDLTCLDTEHAGVEGELLISEGYPHGARGSRGGRKLFSPSSRPKRPLIVPAMRTAGLPHLGLEDDSPFRTLHMVATT